jgi:transcriptional regulator with XRE-family HTH domain
MGRKPKARRDSYGAWLQYLRKEHGLTQQALAKEIGVPQTTLAYWERSGKLPGRMIILRLSTTLKVPLRKLLRQEKNRQG